MRHPLIVSTLCILTGCGLSPNNTASDAVPRDPIYEWETTGTCATEEELYGEHAIDVYRSLNPLHQRGRAAVEDMLEETGLTPIYSLKGIRGVEPLTPELCLWLYKQYNERTGEDLPDDACTMHLQENTVRFPEVGYSPLVFNALEFESRYVVLLVDEEGLGGATLFGIVYDLDEKRLMTIDTERLNAGPLMNHIVYNESKLHYYWVSEYYPGIEEAACQGKEVATFDFATGELWVWGE